MKRKRVLKNYKIEKEENFDQVTEELKQKVSSNMQRISRYGKRQNCYYQNKMFTTECKKLYNLLRQKNINVKNAPTKEKIENFRNAIFGKEIQHNEEAYCIKNMCQQNPSNGNEPNI